MSELRVGPRPRRLARRRRAHAAAVAAREAQRDRRHDDVRGDRRGRSRRARRSGPRHPAHQRRRALLLRVRLRRPQPGGRQAPGRQHPAPAPRAGAPPDPAALHGAGAGRVRGARAGPRASASTSRSPPTSPSPPPTPASGRRSSTAGFTPDSGATWLLPRRVGEQRAREMILLGRVVDGTEAAEWQMIHRAVPARRGRCGRRRARRHARLRRDRRRRAGEVAPAHRRDRPRSTTSSATRRSRMELSSRSEDFREGLKAFQEKRPPEYGGR